MHSSTEMRQIDFNSPLPFYYQLANILREEIEKGTWAIGELIPAEGTLTQMFGVSRSVTRKSLDILEGEGRVLRIKGKGTLVVQSKLSYHGVHAASNWFTSQPGDLQVGRTIEARRVPVGGHIGKLLDMSPREEVWEITLTHDLDGSVVSLSQLYLRIYGTLSLGAPPEFEAGGPDVITQLAAKYELELTESDLELKLVAAGQLEADVLGIEEGSEVVQASSVESGHRVVGFFSTVIKPDNFVFSASVQRTTQSIRNGVMAGMISKPS